MPSPHNAARRPAQAKPRVNSPRQKPSFVALRQAPGRRTKAAPFKAKAAPDPRAMLQPEGDFGGVLLQVIQAGPHDALAELVKRDPVVRLAKATTRLVWLLFHSADLDHHAVEAFYGLLDLEAELEHEISTYGEFARTDQFRHKAVDDVRQLLHAFSEKLEIHRDALEHGEFTGGELR